MSAFLSPAQRLAKEQKRAKRESLELAMLQQLKALGLMEGMERQHKFIPGRQYQADFCWPAARLILEVDGGTWSKGGHSSGAGIERDYERDALAVIFGWRVIRATSNQVLDGSAAFWVESILASGMPAAAQSAGQQPGENHGKTQTRADETRQGTGPRRQARLLTKADLAPRAPIEKRQPVRSESYKRLVAALPCALCRVPGFSQAAHSNQGKGMATKTDDNLCFPLCAPRTGVPGCHADFDQYRLGNAQESAAMAKRWGRATAKKIRDSGLWPAGVPYPTFKD